MKGFSINNYNFENDAMFQEFFKENRPKEFLKPSKFLNTLNYYKRKWIGILNSPVLRKNYGVPMDWGYEYAKNEEEY